MEQFKGVIYQAINIQNKKSYIGKTIQDFEEYKQDHLDGALKEKDLNNNFFGKYFYNAIRKYGPNNFKWIILGEIFSDSKQELKKLLNEAEVESIWLFRTFGSDGIKRDSVYGYNLTKGGDGGDTLSNHPNKEEIFNKLSSSRQRDAVNQWNNLTEIERKIIGENISKGIKNRSEEDKQKSIDKLHSTLENNPNIIINITKNRLETEKNNPEIQIQRTASYKKTLKENPEININKGKKISENRKKKEIIKKECRALIQYYDINNIILPNGKKGLKVWSQFRLYLYNYIENILENKIINIEDIINSYKKVKSKTKWELRTPEKQEEISNIYSQSKLNRTKEEKDTAIQKFKKTKKEKQDIIYNCNSLIINHNLQIIPNITPQHGIKKWKEFEKYLLSLIV